MLDIRDDIFFGAIRDTLFGGKFDQGQVNGINTILGAWRARYTETTPLTQLAYVFATPHHETNKTMQPIHEIGSVAYFTRLYDISGQNPRLARELGNVNKGDGARFPGRGYVQLTGRNNYTRAEVRLRALGVLKPGESLVTNPELAKRPDVAVALLFEGMEGGWFTGGSLDKYIDAAIDGDEHADFVQARRVINGTDRAELVAGYADHYLAGLRKAVVATVKVDPAKPPSGGTGGGVLDRIRTAYPLGG